MKTDLSPLTRFIEKVEKVNPIELAGESTIALKQHFEWQIQDYYPGATVNYLSPQVTGNRVKTTLELHYPELWFKEYGTGYIGQQYPYMGELPKEQLRFYSRGQWQTTQGWEYAYHPDTQKQGYWTWRGQKYYGNAPVMGFAKTTNYLWFNGLKIISQYLQLRGMF